MIASCDTRAPRVRPPSGPTATADSAGSGGWRPPSPATASCPAGRRPPGRCRRPPAGHRRPSPSTPPRPTPLRRSVLTVIAPCWSLTLAQTRSGVIGSSFTCRPITLAIALRDRAGGRDARRLADPLRALRAGVRGVDLDPPDVDRRARRRRSAACSRAARGCAAGRRRRTGSPRSAPARCPSSRRRRPGRRRRSCSRSRRSRGPRRSRVTRTTPVSRSTLTRAAWVISCGARNESTPSVPTQEETFVVGLSGTSPEPLPRSCSPVPARSTMVTALPGEPFTRTVPSASSRSSRLASSFSAARSSSFARTSRRGLDHGPAVVERGLRARRAHVPRARIGVLVEDREVLGPHPELLGGQQRQAPSRPRYRTPWRR